MAIGNIALRAYQTALKTGGGELHRAQQQTKSHSSNQTGGFTDAIADSLKKVNDLQTEKEDMIKAFASGESQNVHELMITLQKAGLAMQMTSAVRGKVMEAYKQLMQTPF